MGYLLFLKTSSQPTKIKMTASEFYNAKAPQTSRPWCFYSIKMRM